MHGTIRAAPTPRRDEDGMAERTLILDIDGVVLDFVTGLHDWAVSVGHRPGLAPAHETEYDMSGMLPGLCGDERRRTMVEYIASPAFGRVPGVEGAREAIERIRREADGLTVVAVTACGDDADVRRARRRNLADYAIDEVRFLPYGCEKTEALLAFAPGSVFVDDVALNVEAGLRAGHRSLLYDRPYNRRDAGFERVFGWDGVVEKTYEAFAKAERRPRAATF
jgi:beta-phosphoglucomutase-like phosphatase (HAD superfamily)